MRANKWELNGQNSAVSWPGKTHLFLAESYQCCEQKSTETYPREQRFGKLMLKDVKCFWQWNFLEVSTRCIKFALFVFNEDVWMESFVRIVEPNSPKKQTSFSTSASLCSPGLLLVFWRGKPQPKYRKLAPHRAHNIQADTKLKTIPTFIVLFRSSSISFIIPEALTSVTSAASLKPYVIGWKSSCKGTTFFWWGSRAK